MTWIPKKPEAAGGPQSRPPLADPGPFGQDYPAVAWHLCSSSWPDGTLRKPIKLELTVFMGKFQLTVRQPGPALMLRVEVPSPDLIYEALEAVLRLDVVPWQDDPWGQKDAPPKSQKKSS